MARTLVPAGRVEKSLDPAGRSACATVVSSRSLRSPAAGRTCRTSPSSSLCGPATFFDDGRSERPADRGHRGARPSGRRRRLLYRHRARTASRSTLSLSPSRKTSSQRGQQRFNVYCAPCHDRTGDGNGMIVRRGYKLRPPIAVDRLTAALQRIYLRRDHPRLRRHARLCRADCSRATAGPSWPTCARCRLSQNATINDVPPEERAQTGGREMTAQALDFQVSDELRARSSAMAYARAGRRRRGHAC